MDLGLVPQKGVSLSSLLLEGKDAHRVRPQNQQEKTQHQQPFEDV